jgi:hypothetical protein
MVAAWLAGLGPPPACPAACAQLHVLRQTLQSAHFCVAESGSTSIRAFTGNTVAQLKERASGFREAASASLSPLLQILVDLRADIIEKGSYVTGANIGQVNLTAPSEEAVFDHDLRIPLITLYAKGYDKPMILLVDALDEALTRTPPRGEIDLVQLLAKLDDLPEQVRILVTTRHDPRVLKQFNNAVRVDLIKDAPVGTKDVRDFAYERLAPLSDQRRNRLATHIADSADGNFLYAHLVISDLLPKLPTLEDEPLVELPEGLPDLYTRFLNRELGANEDRWHCEFKVILGLIAVAQAEGLTLAQLNAITELDAEPTVRRCAQYLEGETPSGPFRPFHRSFALFLLEDEKNAHYHVDAIAMHRCIADYYWNAFRDDWDSSDNYGLDHAATHLFHLRDGDRLLELLDRDRARVRYRRSNYAYTGLADDAGLALQAIQDEDELHLRRGGGTSCIGGQVRCTLLLTSINSVAEKLSPSLLVALVHLKKWTSSQALIHARRIADTRLHLDALVTLASQFSDLRNDALQEGMTLAMKIQDNEQRAEAFTKLLPYVTGAQRAEALKAAVDAIWQLSDTTLRPQQGYYQTHLVPEQTGIRAKHLEELSQTLSPLWRPGSEPPPDARLLSACQNEDKMARDQALAELAPELKVLVSGPGAVAAHISDIEFADRLESQARIGDDEQRAKSMALLAAYVDRPLKVSDGDAPPRVPQAQFRPSDERPSLPDTSAGIREIGVRAYLERAANASIPPRLPSDLVPEALDALRNLNANQATKYSSGKIIVRSIIALAPRLDGRQLSEAAEIVESIYAPFGCSPDKIEAEYALAERMNEPERTKAVTTIWQKLSTMRFDELIYDKIPFLADLAAHLPQPQRQEVFERLVKAVKGAVHRGRGYLTWNLNVRVALATELLTHSPDNERVQLGKVAIEVVTELKEATPIQHGYAQVSWDVLAMHLPKELLMDAEALDPEDFIASNLPDALVLDAFAVSRKRKNAKWLFALAARLPTSLLGDALTVAHEIGGDGLRAELLARVPAFSKMPPPELYCAWVTTLNGLANLSRPGFLHHLSSLGAVLLTLGGTGAVKKTREAIQEIAAWWP